MQHGRPEETLRHQRAAIALRKGLVEEFPGQLSYRVDLARSLSNLGAVLYRHGRAAEALESTREANTIQRTLVGEHPDDPQLRSTLALSTRGMAINLNALGRWQESRPLYAESVEIMSRIVAENPAVTEFRRVLATGAAEFGQFLIDHGALDDGLSALAKAREQSEAVRRVNPNDVYNVNTLASIFRGIGKARAVQGQTAEALVSLRQAIATSERIADEDNLMAYDLACGLALCAEVAGRVPPAPGADPMASSRRYADEAMKVLSRAVERGFGEVDWIERDPELRSLRSRPDFQALLLSLRRKPGVAPPAP